MTTLPTPDPAQGLFETVLILDGEPVALTAHLDRLAAGLATLFDATLPMALDDEIVERSRGLRLGRMRIVVDRAGAGATLTTQEVDAADFFPGRDRGVALRSLPCPGGLGAHKWADRGFLGEVRGEPVPLLFDRGDEVLEAGRGNVFIARHGILRTPALDGRILPGTARAATIGVAREEGIDVREEAFTRDELFGADEVFVTGSVRGVEPAASLDGAPLPAGEGLGRRLGEALRRKWRTGRLVAARS
ncbi:MAG TPA: aminotransferase class IV [Solirubrobacterales bacterium]|nr:aminotransferase class IV [Solirubrobacterales bacterium]